MKKKQFDTSEELREYHAKINGKFVVRRVKNDNGGLEDETRKLPGGFILKTIMPASNYLLDRDDYRLATEEEVENWYNAQYKRKMKSDDDFKATMAIKDKRIEDLLNKVAELEKAEHIRQQKLDRILEKKKLEAEKQKETPAKVAENTVVAKEENKK